MGRDTSAATYHRIEAEGLLSKMRWVVYDLLYRHGPATSSELFEHYKREYAPAFRYNMNLHSRLNELRDRGVVREVDKRECKASGNYVIEWDVTAALPRNVDRVVAPTRREVMQAAATQLAEMCEYLEGKGSAVPEKWQGWARAARATVADIEGSVGYRKPRASGSSTDFTLCS